MQCDYVLVNHIEDKIYSYTNRQELNDEVGIECQLQVLEAL